MAARPNDLANFVRRRREPLAVAALLLVALLLRVYQVDWDQGHLYHPDERYILMTTAGLSLSWPPDLGQLLSIKSTLDPHGFAYGTFSFYLLRLVAAILFGLSHLGFPFQFLGEFNDLGNLRLIGRPISALFDTGTVFIIYQIGKRLYGKKTAFLGAALVAFSVLDIQLSHFYATDTIMTSMALAAILASVVYLREGTSKAAVWAGIFTGLALATKVSAAPVLAPVGLAYLLRLFTVESRSRGVRLRLPTQDEAKQATSILALSIMVGVLVFLIAEPYAIIDFKGFVSGFSDQGSMVRGIADLPYTRQFIGRPPYLYFLQILVFFAVGIPLGLAMIGGWIFVIARAIHLPRKGDLLLLSYVVPYFAITGSFYAKFMRYLLPMTPLLALFAAVALVQLLAVCRGWRGDAEARRGDAEMARDEAGKSDRTDEWATPADWDAPAGPTGDPGPGASAGGAGFAGDARPIGERHGRSLATAAIGVGPGPRAGTVAVSAVDAGKTNGLLPEIVDEALAIDVAELRLLDGELRPTVDLAPGTAELDEIPAVAVAVAEPALDAEAMRFAELKGLSLDWFDETAEAEDDTADGSRERSAGAFCPRDEWIDAVALAEPLPAWIDRRSGLAAFATGKWPLVVARALVGIVVAFSVFYSLAFDHMYDSTSTPVEGSLWLYQHAPRGSTFATEHWEEGMPVPIVTSTGVESADTFQYHNVTMPMYDDDNQAKLDTIVNNLEAADYVVFFSNRLYGTVPRLPRRYPMSHRYYEDLFGEKLGFKLVGAFDRYPNLLGIAFVDDTLNDPGLPTPPLLQQQRVAPITINLGHADESFSVYDHQKVLIFQKVQRLTPDQLRALIGPAPSHPPTPVGGTAPQYKSLLLTPAQESVVQAGGTFRDLFDRTDVFNQAPLLTWIVLIVLIALAGIPLGFFVFRFLPDRGYLVSKTLGVLVLAWLSWMIVSLGITEATRPATLAIFGLYLLLGVGAAIAQRREIWRFVQSNRRLIAIEEGLFWVAFFYDVYVRSLDPDLWHPTLGGEKPMDLAFFTAAARSPIYPPYDPWFSGGYINYYYFGQIVVGTLAKISGVLPTTSYNIVVPFLFALTAVGAFTAAFALIHRGAEAPGRAAVVGGVLASFMVCVLGNLGGFVQLVQQVAAASPVQPRIALPGLGGLAQFVIGAAEIVTGHQPFVIRQDWYWTSTRMLAMLGEQGTGSINEFPYFTFLYADLHAHLIGLPFTLLAIALCVNVVKSRGLLAHLPETRLTGSALAFGAPSVVAWREVDNPTGESAPATEQPRLSDSLGTIGTLVAAGLTLGALYPINTWDFPTYLGLMALSLAIPWYLSSRLTKGGLVTLVARLAIIAVLARILYQPFYAYFQSFYSGVHAIDEKSSVTWFLMINGLFVVMMISYLLVQGWVFYRRTAIVRAAKLYVAKWDLLPRALELQRALVKRWDSREVFAVYAIVWLAIIVAGTVLFGMALTGVLIVLLMAALALGLRRDVSAEDCFVIFLFATGLALAIGTEQVAIDGDVGRMNTVFKFYEQIWVLWGVASAVAIVRTRERLLKLGAGWVQTAWLTLVVIFFAMALVYPVIGTIARVSNRFNANIAPTLDGTAYMDTAVYTDDGHPLHLATDKEAIVWLQDHVDGTPTILEGNRPIYRWGSRISIYTGLPTVIGWDWHEKQQRWGYQDQVDQRVRDVTQMYDDPSSDVTVAMLRSYNVKYVIDGELEQAFYPSARSKFDSMVGKYLSVVYDHDGVKIYQVN